MKKCTIRNCVYFILSAKVQSHCVVLVELLLTYMCLYFVWYGSMSWTVWTVCVILVLEVRRKQSHLLFKFFIGVWEGPRIHQWLVTQSSQRKIFRDRANQTVLPHTKYPLTHVGNKKITSSQIVLYTKPDRYTQFYFLQCCKFVF